MMGMYRGLWLVLLTSLIFLLAACDKQQGSSTTTTQVARLAPFYGTYSGVGEKTHGGDEESERDLQVTIKPWEDKGFTVDWSTIIYRDGKQKQTQMSINFLPSARAGIYSSAMQEDVFGNTIPYNPVFNKDHPYVWAGLENDVLTIHALYVTDNGGYEMQVYRRALMDKGLSLEFERVRNGERVSGINAELMPVEGAEK